MMSLGPGMGVVSLITMILFWGGLVALAIWLVGLLFPTAKKQINDGDASLSAPEILKARYARGELTTQQYQEMWQTLQQ